MKKPKNPETNAVSDARVDPLVIFKPGDRVRHRFAGTGTVIKCKGDNARVLYDDGQKGTGSTVDYKRI